MLTALMLVLAAAPRNPHVLVRFHSEPVERVKGKTLNAVFVALEKHEPSLQPMSLTADQRAELEAAYARAGGFCKEKFPDVDQAACLFHTRAVAEVSAFAPKFDKVLEVAASQLVEKPNILLEMELWSPRTGQGLRYQGPVPLDTLSDSMVLVLGDLLAGKGTSSQHATRPLDELQKTYKSPFKKEAARRGLPLVLHVRKCTEPIPPKLTITPDDGLARTLSASWLESIQGEPVGKEPQSCTLTYVPLIDRTTVVHVELTCGHVKSAWTFRESAPVKDVLADLNQMLLSHQLEGRCGGAFGDTPHLKEHVAALVDGLRMRDAESAIDDLTMIGPRALPYLVGELSNPDAATRRGVATALGAMGAAARDAIPALEKAAADAEPSVAAAAQQALQRIGR